MPWKKYAHIFFLLISIALHSDPTAFADLESSDRFHITQDATCRRFCISSDWPFVKENKPLGFVVNRGPGVFDFYDSNKEYHFTNLLDILLGNRWNHLASVNLASDTEQRWERKNWDVRSNRIVILSKEEKPLVALESGGGLFSFTDCENGKTVAAAQLSSMRPYRHHWEVIVLDPVRLQERNVSHVLLVWALLKHSQKFFPSPVDFPFVDGLVQD